jgi:Fur family ferric uptake transcriptional regulator
MRSCSHAPVDETLKRAGLKRTRPREAVLHFLLDHHGPFSAKDLHRALNRDGLDAVTVYRCLAAFEKTGLVHRCDFGDGTARFEFNGAHHHHHVVCTKCRRVESLDDCRITEWEKKVRRLGYSDVRHVLEFSGICRLCRA